MPIYEYRCEKCKEQFEVQQSIKDFPLKKHKKCGGILTKLFFPMGIIFKGSGFYITDTRNNTQNNGKKWETKNAKSTLTAATDKNNTNMSTNNKDNLKKETNIKPEIKK